MYKYKASKDYVLKGRTMQYVANNILDIHPFYLSNILHGKIGCSKRLAKQITELISPEAKISDYFIIKEK